MWHLHAAILQMPHAFNNHSIPWHCFLWYTIGQQTTDPVAFFPFSSLSYFFYSCSLFWFLFINSESETSWARINLQDNRALDPNIVCLAQLKILCSLNTHLYCMTRKLHSSISFLSVSFSFIFFIFLSIQQSFWISR